VHLLVSIPPQVTISRLMQWLKGETAHKIMSEFPHSKKHHRGQHMWARGYFCCSTGNVTDESSRNTSRISKRIATTIF
jgi:putative transposase